TAPAPWPRPRYWRHACGSPAAGARLRPSPRMRTTHRPGNLPAQCGWPRSAPARQTPAAARSQRHQQYGGLCGDAFLASGETELLAGGGLDTDPFQFDPQQVRDFLAHRQRMRADLGPLADHGDVGIADLPPTFGQQRVAMCDEPAAVRALPVVIR